MTPRSFSNLAPELVLCVMRSMDSPADLFNLVRSSRSVYQVFSQSREHTLESVLQNAITPAAMSDALAACKASEVSKLWWREPVDCTSRSLPPAAGFRDSRIRFIDAYHRNYSPDLDIDKSRQRSLLRLWNIANNFLLGFRDHAYASAGRLFPNLQPGWDKPVSKSEQTRLLRALFRFETFRRLFPELSSIGADPTTKQDFRRFLNLFSPREREEILAIQEYLVSFAKDIYRELQSYVLQRLRCIGDAMQRDAKKRKVIFEKENIEAIRAGLDLQGLDVFQSRQFTTRRRFQHLVARGFPFLHWLSSLAPNERIFTLNVCLGSECRSTFFELMYENIGHPELHYNLATSTVSEEGLGWELANQQGLEILERHALRQAGLVFWDTKRLQDRWHLSKTSLSALKLAARSQNDNDDDWDKEPMMNERFRDIAVVKGFFLEREDGAEAVFKVNDSFLEGFEDDLPLPFSPEENSRYHIEY